MAMALVGFTGMIAFEKQTVIEPRKSVYVIAPPSVLSAYRSGKMTATDTREFLFDLQSGELTLPEGESIVLPRRFDQLPGLIAATLGVSAFFAAVILILQYLVVGYASPARLFCMRREEGP